MIQSNKNNLKELRNSRNISQEKLAELTGYDRTHIGKLEKGIRRITSDARKKLADALYISVDDIIVEDNLNSPSSPNLVTLKLYNHFLSAGDGIFTFEEENYTPIEFQRKTLEELTGINPNNLVVLRCLGDSMLPTIDEDAYLIIDTSETDNIKNDGIYAFNYGGFFRVKRIQVVPNGLKVISDNKKYETEFIELPPKYEFQIIGRVRNQFFKKV